MKILLITSAFPNFHGDPRGTFIRTLAQALVREGIEVTLLAPGAPGAPSRELVGGIEVHRATYWIPRYQGLALGLSGIVPNLIKRPWLIFQAPLLIAALAWKAIGLAKDADLIHAHWVYPSGLAGVAASRWTGVPLVVTSHGGDLNLARRHPILRWISRGVSRAADACIGVSHAMVERFRELGVTEESVRFIPLGINANAEPASGPAAVVQERFLGCEGIRVLYAGSLIPLKSVETLLKAHHRLESQRYQVATAVVGGGPCEQELRQYASAHGLKQVFFAGSQPPEQVRSWMEAADVLVLPSTSEGRGMVVVEAMAVGKPVITSDIPGPRELIWQRESGLLFPVGDHAELARCLERLILEPGLREPMGQRGKAIVEEEGLRAESCARRHRELYLEILAGRFQDSTPTAAATCATRASGSDGEKRLPW